MRGAVKLALGLGCDRGTPAATVQQALDEALAQASGVIADIAAVASIDLKADEAGFAELARRHGWTIRYYPAAELARVAVPNPSETVRRYTGTPSVSEAAALLAAGQPATPTAAAIPAALTALVVEKHKLRGADGRNATISLARIPQ